MRPRMFWPTRRPIGAVSMIVAVVVLAACSGDKEARPNAPAAPVAVTPDSAQATESPLRWDPAVGTALLLVVDSVTDSVQVVRPEYVDGVYSDTGRIDLRTLGNTRYDLFGRSGVFGTSALQTGIFRKSDASDGCTEWPTASLLAATRVRLGWDIGLESGRATAIALDSIDAMSSADSARFAIEVTRLAANLPKTRDSVFGVVPFLVRNAFRFRTSEIEGVIANVQRSIHSEANPREEQLFLIAERPVGGAGAYRVAFSRRGAGAEGGTAVVNVLTLVALSDGGRPAMIVSLEYEEGASLELIERRAPGMWTSTWRSAYSGC